MHWHIEALTPESKAAVDALRNAPFLDDFYLAGGTALALRFGHRISVDLDFFSGSNRLGFRQREAVKNFFEAAGSARFRQEIDGTLYVDFKKTAISLLWYDYPLIRPALSWGPISIASIEDIALMKLGAIIGRGAKKDFIDLFSICRTVPLLDILRLSPKKFPNSQDFLIQSAKALVYFEDADTERMPELLKDFRWLDVKRFFLEKAPKVFEGLLH